MSKFRWLTVLGVLCLITVFIVGLTAISSSYRGFENIFIVLGVLLSIIIIGLGEILYHLQNGNKNE